jgi:hypothetical protein
MIQYAHRDGDLVAVPTEGDLKDHELRAASLAGPQRCTGVRSGEAAGCADKVAGLPRHPGRVASGGEAEANVAWPPTRRAGNLRSLRERAQAGPERPRSPRGCLQPPLSASRPDPTQRSTLALKDLRAESVGAALERQRRTNVCRFRRSRRAFVFPSYSRPEPRGELNPLSTERASGHGSWLGSSVTSSARLRPTTERFRRGTTTSS